MDIFYMPRSSRDSVDLLYGEDTLKTYTSAYPLEMYLEDVTGMEGEGDFMSKFGLEIRDELTFLVSRRRFAFTVNQLRPNEGDLIYVPMLQNFFEITFVEHENGQAMYYTLGRGRGGNVYVYALKLKQYVFSDEVVDTGVTEVDEQVFDLYRRTNIPYAETGNNIRYRISEIVYQGSDLANANAQGIVHSVNTIGNNYLQLIRVQGNFANGTIIIGETSNARYGMIGTIDDMTPFDTTTEDLNDNYDIEFESDDIIDFTEVNPFGEP